MVTRREVVINQHSLRPVTASGGISPCGNSKLRRTTGQDLVQLVSPYVATSFRRTILCSLTRSPHSEASFSTPQEIERTESGEEQNRAGVARAFLRVSWPDKRSPAWHKAPKPACPGTFRRVCASGPSSLLSLSSADISIVRGGR
jgi:hypothetical protein